MNILVLGSGGREHTLAWKISQSFNCTQVFVAPGNAGTDLIAENVDIQVNDFKAIGEFSIENEIDLIVVGPEDPLVNGFRDYFEADEKLKKIGIVGPGKAGAQLEGSKDFSKVFMQKHGVPTADAKTFTAESINDGIAYLDTCQMPIVLKADGLAAGKGVVIAQTLDEAKNALNSMLVDKQFGEASAKVLIEQYLDGIELSVFVLSDGTDYIILPEAKDYKRINDGDTGLNTGGMGAVSPVKFADKAFMDKVEEEVIKPTINGLKSDGIDYKGFIFIGLMNVGGEPFVIEYNVRMGDPETQVVIPRIQSDIVEMLLASAEGTLKDYKLIVDNKNVVGVVLVSGGYPGSYEKGKSIQGLADVTGTLVIHSGTSQEDYEVLTNGGRVLTIIGRGDDLETAINNVYKDVKYISWEGMHYRKDIGKDILATRLV
jgi:phosphoribosylamine--glycine ligase